MNSNLDLFEQYGLSLYIENLFLSKIRYNNNWVKINLFHFSNFLNLFKIFKRKYLFRLLYKIHKKNELILIPSHLLLSQYFEYRVLFWNILNKNNINGFFIYKNLFKITSNFEYHYWYKFFSPGYNFYISNSNQKTFDYLNLSFKDKEFNKIGKIKFFLNLENEFQFNYYFLYNIYLLNASEIYKILIYLHLLNLYKN